MSTPPPLPGCPQCGRRIAAWRLDHCVYCGAVFPADFKQGVEAPETLKWIDRPNIPADAARQLELMKVVPQERDTSSRSVGKILALASLPIFGGIIFLLYRILLRYGSGFAILAVLVGAVFLGYLVWSAFRSSG
ncbi:MAG TPA: hypothetical protein VK780_00545 [Thermoanaerobaculia bacterium]|nr:hypothetical protein [Thermoanaerobaculia bacterium]